MRYCPQHTDMPMTLLFNFYVCDICKPPKGSATGLVPPMTTICNDPVLLYAIDRHYPGTLSGHLGHTINPRASFSLNTEAICSCGQLFSIPLINMMEYTDAYLAITKGI